jgi:undecaprenyl-diphosphatase
MGDLLGFTGERASSFEIFIQLGAILAVVLLYRRRFASLFRFRRLPDRGLLPMDAHVGPDTMRFGGPRGLALLAVATVPALILGAATRDVIKEYLFNPTAVAIGLVTGGTAILVLEARLPPFRFSGLDALTWRAALVVGLFQCLSLWAGISRAAATIIGGVIVGADRRTAAEFSFLVAVPTLFAAALYDLYLTLPILTVSDVPVFLVGFVVAFGAAWLAIRFFLRLLASHTLSPFGWYRIALALVVLLVLR